MKLHREGIWEGGAAEHRRPWVDGPSESRWRKGSSCIAFNNRLGANEIDWKYGRKNHFLKKSKSEKKQMLLREGGNGFF